MIKPLISVIICFLNPGNWLAEAIESVLSQTYSHWELLLIDDGSQLQDSQLAVKYAQLHPNKIIYTDHEAHCNIGLTSSRNKGIALSSGQLIAFLDADDYWYPNKLGIQLKLFNDFPDAAMICEASRFWYSWADLQANDFVIHIGAPEGLYKPGDLTGILYPLGQGQPPCPTGIIIQKEALYRSGVFEERFKGIYQLYEDQAFLAKIYLTENVYISSACNNKYRKHNRSMSGAAADKVIYTKVRNFFLDWFIAYTREKHLAHDELENLIIAARV